MIRMPPLPRRLHRHLRPHNARAAGVPSCIAVVKALADKHGYHTAEVDE